jgi:hypothetical protein
VGAASVYLKLKSGVLSEIFAPFAGLLAVTIGAVASILSVWAEEFTSPPASVQPIFQDFTPSDNAELVIMVAV